MQISVKQQVLEALGFFIAFALALFLPAGTLAWPAGWVFLLLFFAFYLSVTFWLYRHNPGLMQERMRLGTPDQKAWDKVLFPLMEISFILWLIFMSLDAVRFHWSRMLLWVQAIGTLILLCSFSFLFLTFRENSYLSPVVRVQEERGHTVVTTGLYRHVRHPMYMAILIFIVGTSLLLGSWYGLIFVIICMAILARRAVLEEQMLLKELSGYADYKAQVKYRLIPYVW